MTIIECFLSNAVTTIYVCPLHPDNGYPSSEVERTCASCPYRTHLVDGFNHNRAACTFGDLLAYTSLRYIYTPLALSAAVLGLRRLTRRGEEAR